MSTTIENRDDVQWRVPGQSYLAVWHIVGDGGKAIVEVFNPALKFFLPVLPLVQCKVNHFTMGTIFL